MRKAKMRCDKYSNFKSKLLVTAGETVDIISPEEDILSEHINVILVRYKGNSFTVKKDQVDYL